MNETKSWHRPRSLLGAVAVALGVAGVLASARTSFGWTPLSRPVAISSPRLQGVMPAGTVVAFAGDVAAVPAGWLLCDGRAISRAAYAALFTAVGTAHGGGDGATTFNLPDYRGYFLRGVDLESGNDPHAGSRVPVGPAPWKPEQVGSRQNDATRLPTLPFVTNTIPAHAHQYQDHEIRAASGTVVDRYARGSSDAIHRLDVTKATGFVPEHSHTVAGGDKETRPKNKYVHWIIKD